MEFIDTHAHLYLPEFDNDREEVLKQALEMGVSKVLLPNIDSGSIERLLALADRYRNICYPMMGLHPTSVKENYKEELKIIEDYLRKGSFIAVGEVGIDLYWDKSFFNEQVEVFKREIDLSLELDLPLVIHCRDSFSEIFEILEKYTDKELKGVFHAFTGNVEEARRVIDLGFLLGIGGIVTFKNSGLGSVVKETGIEKILLETDSPYLAPTPNRGKRNESSYIRLIAESISQLTGLSLEEISETSTCNAKNLFKI